MQVNQEPNLSKHTIQAYQSGPSPHLTVNHKVYTTSVLFHKEALITWRPTQFEDLKPTDFEIILEQKPSIFLLGTGFELKIPSMDLLRPLFEQGIGVEFMSTGSAIRTYVVLSSEQREVGMGLIL